MRTRWDRLAANLNEAGIPAEVNRYVWCGEIVSNITMLIDGGLIHIRDTAWHGHWTGWQVTAEDAEGGVIRWFPKTKNRNEVRRQVEDARALVAETAESR